MTFKIISGGQTGVDQAALRFAVNNNIAYGGWCPKSRLAENGVIPKEFDLQETDSIDYSVRTIKNIEDSDGTLILVPSLPLSVNDGTVLTVEKVKALNKSRLIIDLSNSLPSSEIRGWIERERIEILNIAGPGGSQCPGIYNKAF